MKNIKVKLLFWYSIITVIIISIFTLVLLDQFYKQNVKTVDTQLKTVISEINYNKHFYTPFDYEEFMIKNLYITIYEYKENKFIKWVYNKTSPSFKNIKVLNSEKFQIFTTENNIRVMRFHSNKLSIPIYIEVATTLDDKIASSLENLENILFVLIPALLILSLIAGYFIIKNALIPVRKTINEVKDIEANHLNKRITSYTSNDEIEELVTTFNFMLDKLDDSFSKIKRFSNDVSHELKTPLTVIRGEIEIGLRKDRTNNEYRNILSSTLEETKILQELINSLLFLSKTNKEEIQSKFELVELDEIITDVISQNKQLLEEKSIHIKFKKFDSVSCHGQILLLRIFIGNIIQNSIKYSHKNSIIEISLDKDILTIKDYGIGIETEDIKNIFNRFYRVDKSRSRGGYGLGLSIVKSIGELHNFSIEVDSQYNKYTQFSINLKRV